MMLAPVVPGLLPQSRPLFQSLVHSLMPATGLAHCLLVALASGIQWSDTSILTPVSFISKHFFTRCKHLLESVPKDTDIWIALWCVRPIEMDNITSSNTNSHLVPESCRCKFLSILCCCKGLRLSNPKVCSINSHQSNIPCVVSSATSSVAV